MPVAAPGLDRARVRSPVELLAIRDFRVWWLGFVVSANANTASAFGVGWLVVELARDGAAGTAAFYLGLVGLCRLVPTLAFGAFGGVAGDRYDRRTVVVVSQAGMGVTVLAMGLLVATGTMGIAGLAVLSALNAVAAAFYHPVRQAIQPRLVGEANMMFAIGFNGATLNVAALLGPLIGGVLVVWTGVDGLLIACGVAAIAVAGSLATNQPQPVTGTGAAGRSILRLFTEGLGYARRTPRIRWVLIVFAAVTLVMRPLPFMLPALADALDLGARELSWLVSGAGAGGICATVLLMWLRQAAHAMRLALVGTVAAGLNLAVLSAQHTFLALLVLVVTTQFFVIISCGLCNIVLQTTTPDQFRGRVVGIQSLLADSGTEGGVFLVGAIGGVLGIAAALGASGGALAALGLSIAIGVRALTRPAGVAS